MRALILNSGMGSRMGELTDDHPKCMTEIGNEETIISRQLKQLKECGIAEVIITTGFFDKVLVDYCTSLNLGLNLKFVNNPDYDKTNYIYSIYLARNYLEDDIILMHGDLVYELEILQEIIKLKSSCMTISSTIPLPKKDFKAAIENGMIKKIGVNLFENAVTAQPLYKIYKKEWKVWLNQIILYCKNDKVSCYAENAFNDISEKCPIYPFDFKDSLCGEIDTPDDLEYIKKRLNLNI